MEMVFIASWGDVIAIFLTRVSVPYICISFHTSSKSGPDKSLCEIHFLLLLRNKTSNSKTLDFVLTVVDLGYQP